MGRPARRSNATARGDAPAPVPRASSRTAPAASGRSRQLAVRWGGSLLLVLAAAAAAIWLAPQRREAGSVQSARRGAAAQLAVMPLRVLGGPETAENSYIGVGIADAITTRLANIRQIGLRPTSRRCPTRMRNRTRADRGCVASTLALGTIRSGGADLPGDVQP